MTSVDVIEADDVAGQIRQLVEANDNGARQFVRHALQGRMRIVGDDNGPVT